MRRHAWLAVSCVLTGLSVAALASPPLQSPLDEAFLRRSVQEIPTARTSAFGA